MRYRSENISGSEVRDILSVMTYEIYNMGNADILTFLIPTIDDMSENDIREICHRIVQCLNNIYHKNLRYCLWLADWDIVMRCYGHDKLDSSDIDEYKESDIILSKIEPDGSLYAYEEYPVKNRKLLSQKQQLRYENIVFHVLTVAFLSRLL